MNMSATSSLPTSPETAIWYRAIQPHFLTTALSTSHTKTIPSRFNIGASAAPQFEILYLAENHMVALFEVQALLGSPLSSGGVVPHPRRAWTILNVTVNLQSIVDLTASASQTILDTTAQELTGDWRGYQLRGVHSSVTGPSGSAPTQDLGSALFNTAGVEGFRSLSAKLSDQMVLIVFPQKLKPGSSIQFLDPTTGQTRSILPATP
jgi:RES domain-containing protein